MKISFNWLKKYIDINQPVEEVCELLTRSGLEVEGIAPFQAIEGGLEGLVAGEVISCTPHPNADKLKLTQVNVGNGEPLPIVCGAPNVAEGQKVIVATVGTTLYPSGHEPFKIKKSKIRGEVSQGMICAEDEIGMGQSHDGILVLPENTKPGTPAADVFQLETDYVIEIGLTPNRVDAASHVGVARDLKALYRKATNLPDVSVFQVNKQENPVKVTVENAAACPRYSGLTISGIEVKGSPEWLQNRLKAIGLSPINNIVDITNYVLHELGQPLHAFDLEEVGTQVIVKNLPEGTAFTTLDEKQRQLAATDLMICNEKEGMCIAGVFGGIKSGVKAGTQSIFLESAYFSPDAIRKTAQKHGLKTDASFRFERGTDPNMTVYALKRAALLIQELAGGEITSDIVDIYPEAIPPFEVSAKYKNINTLIGKNLTPGEIHEILNYLDIEVKDTSNAGFTAVVPPYRVDVTREADLIEEILRIYGYDNIPTEESLSASYLAYFPQRYKHAEENVIRHMLAASGYSEMINNSLTKSAYTQDIESFHGQENVPVLNRLSEDLDVLRPTLLFSGLEVIARNINRQRGNLKLFEFGKSYRKTQQGYEEKELLTLYITGDVEEENWLRKPREAHFHDLYETINKLLAKYGIKAYEANPVATDMLGYGLEIQVDNQPLVQLGKVKSNLTGKAEVEQAVFYAELDWSMLFNREIPKVQYQSLSRFPEVRRDLSLVLDKHIAYSEVKQSIANEKNPLIQNVNIFDVYEGKNLDESKKAYTISIILQDKSKTLTDKAIDKTMNKLIERFKSELNATIRH